MVKPCAPKHLPSDVEKVLAIEEHESGISVEVYHNRVEERKLDPRRFVLSGFDDGSTGRFVSSFIHSCSQGADHVWEILDHGDSIVVTFKQDIGGSKLTPHHTVHGKAFPTMNDVHGQTAFCNINVYMLMSTDAKSFLQECSSKLDLKIAACRLELTDSVLVQGDMSQINKETLNLYFCNKKSQGGDIRSLVWVTQDKSAVISFEDCHGTSAGVWVKLDLNFYSESGIMS